MERTLYHAYFINHLIDIGEIKADEVESVGIILAYSDVLKCSHPQDLPRRQPVEEKDMQAKDIKIDENQIYLRQFIISRSDKRDEYIHLFGFCKKCKTIYYKNELKKDYIYKIIKKEEK